MGSSVDFFSTFALWNTFYERNGHINHAPRKLWISWGYFLRLSYGVILFFHLST